MKSKRLIISILLAAFLIMSATIASMATITYDIKTSVNTDGSYTFYVSADNDQGGANEYQWYECDASGGNANAIAGASANVYQPSISSETRYFYCMISYASEDGVESVTTKVIKAQGHEEEKPDVEIMTFAITDISQPETDASPDTSASVSGSAASGCTITSVSWDPKHSTFQPETSYTVTVTLKLTDGYVAGEDFKCTINGNRATVSGASGGDTVVCYYSFGPTEAAIVEEEEEPADTTAVEEEEEEDTSDSFAIPSALWVIVVLLLVIAAVIFVVSKVKDRSRSRNAYAAESRKADKANKAISEEAAQQEDIDAIKRIRSKERKNIQRQAQEDLDSLNGIKKDGSNGEEGLAEAAKKAEVQEAEKADKEEKPKKRLGILKLTKEALEKKITKDDPNPQEEARNEEPEKEPEEVALDNNISYFTDSSEDGMFDPSKFI